MPRFGHVCILALSLTVVATVRAGEDDYGARFQKATAARDAKAATAALGEWKRARPDDPEYYIAAANDALARGSRIKMNEGQPAPGEYSVTQPETKQQYRISEATDPAAVQGAIDLLKEAVTKAPERIDLRFRLAALHEDAGEAAAVVKCLSDLVDYAKAHPGKLRDAGGKPYPEPADEKTSYAISAFAGRYFERDTTEDNKTFSELARLDLRAFPDCEYGYNLMGNYYCSIDRNPKLALENYERALQFNPKDSLVLDNIGIIHLLTGDNEAAIKSFEQVIALDNDPEYVAKAKRQLERLR